MSPSTALIALACLLMKFKIFFIGTNFPSQPAPLPDSMVVSKQGSGSDFTMLKSHCFQNLITLNSSILQTMNFYDQLVPFRRTRCFQDQINEKKMFINRIDALTMQHCTVEYQEFLGIPSIRPTDEHFHPIFVKSISSENQGSA